MDINWMEGFEIRATTDEGAMRIAANRQGLVSLANILLALAEEDCGAHVHLDEHNSLEDGSSELIIEKV